MVRLSSHLRISNNPDAVMSHYFFSTGLIHSVFTELCNYEAFPHFLLPIMFCVVPQL